jgi:hypothetical protein
MHNRTVRYWAIAPFEWKNQENWNQVWQYDLSHNVISIGYGVDRNPKRLGPRELLKELRQIHKTRTTRSVDSIFRMVWAFYHEIKPRDIVIARKGLKCIAAVGKVKRAAHFDGKRITGNPFQYENFLDVDWQDEPRDLVFSRVVFGQPTLQPMAKEKFDTLIGSYIQVRGSIDIEECGFPEGRELYKRHRERERNQKVIREAKVRRTHADPLLRCDVCRLSFAKRYGQLGMGYIEAHHMVPISEYSRVTRTKLEDIALVCSNCHRMLHRRRPWLQMDQLKQLLVFPGRGRQNAD